MGDTERMRISSDGSVGIGVSSPAYKLNVAGDMIADGDGNGRSIGFDFYGALKYNLYTDGATDADKMHIRKGTTNVATFDSSGNVGIGVSSPSSIWSSSYDALQIGLGGSISAHGGAGHALKIGSNFVYEGTAPNYYDKYLTTSTAGKYEQDNDGHKWFTAASGTAGNAISWQERMRIDSSGNLLVGKSSQVSAGRFGVQYDSGQHGVGIDQDFSGGGTFINFLVQNGAVGSIQTSGTATSYNTSSDYRLKEDDVPMTDATERVKALRPVNFAWKADGSRVDGFFAHELAEVVPEAATGTKDAMRDEEYEVTPAVKDDEGNKTTAAVMGTRSVPDIQGIDQSKLVPLLTATIQELIARIEILEGK
jgi:hypothetical protein